MSNIVGIIKKLFPYHYSIVSEGSDAAISGWLKELPFTIHEFPTGMEINGWKVGEKWKVKKALITKDGKKIYDGSMSPLAVIQNSISFSGKVSLEELNNHLFYSDYDDEAIVYNWTQLYRTKNKSWGFCVPKSLYTSLQDGDYDIDLEVEETTGTMKVLDYCLEGDSEETIVINGHNCHPFQANDDLSGCVVGVEILKALKKLNIRKYTYRLVIAPELIGTVFWLDKISVNIKSVILLKAIGNSNDLKLQESFTGNTEIDIAAHHIFKKKYHCYKSGKFRSIYGNDETVFEAPGYRIPTISLTRMPFDQYHTNQDTPDRLSESALLETKNTVLDIINVLEINNRYQPCFKGLICLSNPKYDLYIPAPAPGIDKDTYSETNKNWNLMMNCLPRHFEERLSLLEISELYGISIFDLRNYVNKWEEKGLIENLDSTSKRDRID